MWRHAGSENRSQLQKRLVFVRQAIDARRDHALNGGRDFEGLPGCLGATGDATADELPGDLLDKERDLSGMAEDAGLERIEIGSRAEQIVEQQVCRGGIERPKPYPQHIKTFKPRRRIFGPPGQQHQQRPTCRKRHQSFNDRLALAIDPMQILQQQHRRPRRNHSIQRVANGIDNDTSPQQGLEIAPAKISDGLVKNGIECRRPKLGMRRHGFLA